MDRRELIDHMIDDHQVEFRERALGMSTEDLEHTHEGIHGRNEITELFYDPEDQMWKPKD